jgi:SAM-dependent methyltransferase
VAAGAWFGMASNALGMTADARRNPRPLYVVTILTGSFLLFLVQPMIARMALPRLGGAPAVWNSAMLVYQALLLGGYAYAHALGRLKPRRQAWVHLALLALAALMLPIGLIAAVPPADASPALWVPWLLAVSIGPLFFAVAAQAPLMQRWYASSEGAADPYALYVASNLGSFAGLIAYPLVVEPLMTLRQQSWLWTIGYGLLALLVAACAVRLPGRAAVEAPVAETPRPTGRQWLRWMLLAFVPSGLMLSTTTHLTTDIVAMPLLWVLPLGLYLLSFSVAFADNRRLVDALTTWAPLLMLVAGGFAFADGSRNPLPSAALGLLLLFTVAVVLHGAMYRLRPAADHLTSFYLAMSVGGALGGLFCALIAPLVFDWAYEHPILVVLAGGLIPQRALFGWTERLWNDSDQGRRLALWLPPIVVILSLIAARLILPQLGNTGPIVALIAIVLLAVMAIGRRSVYLACLIALMMSYGGWVNLGLSIVAQARTRSYFGIYTVIEAGKTRRLSHGTTVHGIQNLTPGHETDPTSYYAPKSGVGLAMRLATTATSRVGVVGLGAGTLACYARPGQDWRFYEIDPAIATIAEDRSRFTFLSRCLPHAPIVIGDARLSLAEAPVGGLDLLVIDAFSSDSVPMHLLTHEAFAVYQRALAPGGLLMIHISNRYIRLEPVLAGAAQAGGWAAALRDYQATPDDKAQNRATSMWVAMSHDPAALARLTSASAAEGNPWRPLNGRPGFAAWTDDHASILPLLRLWNSKDAAR